MACTPSTVFTWIGFLLANLGFITLTTWGIISEWVIGLIVCLVYSIFLFVLVVWLERRVLKKNTSNEEMVNEDDSIEIDKNFRLVVYLLYFLAVISMGTAGVIISTNVLGCNNESNGSMFVENNGWVADMSTIPADLQTWAVDRNIMNAQYNTFSFFSASGTTIFAGNDGIEEDGFTSSKLWQLSNTQEPTKVDQMYFPNTFTRNPSSETTCFIAAKITNIRQLDGFVDYDTINRLVCTDDGDFFRSVEDSVIRNPRNLIWNDEKLWLFGQNPDSNDWGYLIFSVDLSSMGVTLHSKKEVGASLLVESCESDNFRNINISILFLSALPVTFVSLFLWWKRKVPTLPITAYLGISESAITIYLASLSETQEISPSFFQWWFGISSALWFLSLFFLYLVKRISKETLAWSLRFCALVFIISMIVLIGVPGQYDDWWRWVTINFAVFVPLIFVGLVTESAFVLVLGAIGLFIDIWKIAFSIIDATDANEIIIYFAVFLIAGGMLGVFGWYLSKVQDSIRDFTLSFFTHAQSQSKVQDRTRKFTSFFTSAQSQRENEEENSMHEVVIDN